jgi:hypothetical protein
VEGNRKRGQDSSWPVAPAEEEEEEEEEEVLNNKISTSIIFL